MSLALPTPMASLTDKLLSGRGIWPAVPAIVYLVVVVVVPLCLLLSFGVTDIVIARGDLVSQSFTTAHLVSAFTDRLFYLTFWRSISLGLSVTALCVVLGFPVAYLYVISGRTMRRILLILTLAPLLTSGVVRAYAWLVILGGRGLVNGAMMEVGLIDQPLRIVNTHWAVLIGMVQIHLPVMILPLIAVISRQDSKIEEASANLGASRFDTLRHVILPLSLPGIGTGAALVFALSYTTFVAPQVLGGGNYLNAATMAYEQIIYALDWSRGAVTSLILLFTCLAFIGLFSWLTNIGTRWARIERH